MPRLSISIAQTHAFVLLLYPQYYSKFRKFFVWLFGFFSTKREKEDNSEFIHPTMWLDAARPRLGASEGWRPWTLRATPSLWKSNLTSSLVWHCETKCANRRALFSVSEFSSVWEQVWNESCYYPHLLTTGKIKDLNIKHGWFSPSIKSIWAILLFILNE